MQGVEVEHVDVAIESIDDDECLTDDSHDAALGVAVQNTVPLVTPLERNLLTQLQRHDLHRRILTSSVLLFSFLLHKSEFFFFLPLLIIPTFLLLVDNLNLK